jgi:hypothetical protein
MGIMGNKFKFFYFLQCLMLGNALGVGCSRNKYTSDSPQAGDYIGNAIFQRRYPRHQLVDVCKFFAYFASSFFWGVKFHTLTPQKRTKFWRNLFFSVYF